MSRGFGKYRRGSHTHASFHFDSIFKENTNKPSAARSAATVGKWGITSFTSIRTANGARAEKEKKPEEIIPKPKKFFKSRNSDPCKADPDADNNTSAYDSNSKRFKADSDEKVKSRKFFSSKNKPEKTVLSSNVNNKKEENKPPIVLRICKGKSQLVSDSEESEGTPTPSTASSTSPRILRERTESRESRPDTTPQSARSPNCRITRSARRSMQQDPGSSPAAGDVLSTSGDFSLFTSPRKEPDLSPQYIPADKYELERKAMYDSLLRANTPPNQESDSEDVSPNNDKAIHVTEALEKEEDLSMDIKEEDEEIISEPPEEKEVEKYVAAPQPQSASPSPEPEVFQPQHPDIKKTLSVDDWSDSDSNSTANDLEVKRAEPDSDNKPPSMGDPESHEEESEITNEAAGQAPVKLVISKKKGSIFKSRALVADGTKKRRALYKHKWMDDNKEPQKNPDPAASNQANSSTYDDFGFEDKPLTRIEEVGETELSTKVTCTRNDKGYYTVVRNVKKAHQIQEIGEFQEFNDDVEYILDTLQDNNPISTRCLSAITLASKCMVPAFRMHVRAHGVVAKFFKALHDATKDQSLGLCTATVMFVLSQDRLNMDLDRDCLELMLNLLESDVSYQQALDVCGLSTAQLEKNKQKVRELCAEIQSQGHAMHLNLDLITVGQLAMETLLSLTSKRAGEWFKEELRELGGLEHIMKTICECCRQVSDYVVSWTDALLDKLKKVDRCLRVLENVTHNNEENQSYLLKHDNGVILDTLVNLYKLCDREIPLYPVTDITDKESTGTIIREALLVTLKLLINLTHHFNKKTMGSTLIGSRPGIVETSLHLLLQVPHYIPEQKKFELGVLVLMLMINLIQDNEANKRVLLDAKAPSKLESIYSREESAVEALIAQFYHWEGCAKIAEKRTNAILDGEKDETEQKTQPKTNEEFIEETVAKLLQKAGTHMEYTFLASYIVMLIGFLIMDSAEYQLNVRQYLKGNNFVDMVELLQKFFNFMKMTASTEASSVCAIKTTEKIIKFLVECDKPKVEQSTSYSTGMDLSYTMAP